MQYTRLLLIVVATLFAAHSAKAQSRFEGEIMLQEQRDGRNMKLTQPFGYIDSKGQLWQVPAGTETDGASIPRIFWVTHPPFTGKYRRAAVIHDHYCRIQSRSWQDTH